MAAVASTSAGDSQSNNSQPPPSDRLKLLYPAVHEEDTPLPRSWSPKDKYNFIGLSQNNLRVHYKGVGKTHKDAASVRATHAIPASCGIYYFEVKIISKGRDGYMGVGLSAQGVNMNRLPGWDKHSYGYHGDDGHSFCSSGTGQPYGPTFTTGDIIGCCVNLIDNTCFYTKNGVNLGIAFRDLPPNLYPTVGLQTPGEVVEANFGNSPFMFDIEDYMRIFLQEWRMKTRLTIERFPVPDKKGEWQTVLQKIVSTYLVHHGYCATAESFARNTGQAFEEELASIKNRQRIQRLVLAGRMGEAIETTKQLYPGLLERDANLLFMLKCRQFIEMVNGTDSEVRGPAIRSPKSRHSSGSARSSPSMSPVHHPVHSVSASVISGTARAPSSGSMSGSSGGSSPKRIPTLGSSSSNNANNTTTKSHSSAGLFPGSNNNPAASTGLAPGNGGTNILGGGSSPSLFSEADMNATNNAMNGDNVTQQQSQRGPLSQPAASLNVPQIHMDTSDVDMADGSSENGTDRTAASNGTASNGLCTNGVTNQDMECDMEVDQPSSKRQLCGGNPLAIEKMLQYGRELQSMSVQLRREYGKNESNKKALQDAFSLLAYQDPWNSPVGQQLDPVQREPICAALNSSILESHGLPKQPPLELAIGQATQCMKLMSKHGIGSCAFANVSQYLQ